jgi:hypothetical protein
MSHSDGAVSSPEQAAATDMVKDRRITELAHASKDAWCSELSFSLDAEKAFVVLVEAACTSGWRGGERERTTSAFTGACQVWHHAARASAKRPGSARSDG